MKNLDLSIVDGLATVSLNRPEKKNALTEESFNALYEAGVSLQQTPGLRAVIITGAGADFCAGIDL
ncbi:MAG: enoyl-CoA hydratase-related protein, partial [Pseudomonadales bacterium]